jgi:hypothetical protein
VGMFRQVWGCSERCGDVQTGVVMFRQVWWCSDQYVMVIWIKQIANEKKREMNMSEHPHFYIIYISGKGLKKIHA